MALVSQNQKDFNFRQRLSIELCNNFIKRLNPLQSKETKIGAVIAIKNLIRQSKINDSFLFSYLVDTLTDPDKEVRNIVIKVIKEVANTEIIELLEVKLNELNRSETKNEVKTLLKALN